MENRLISSGCMLFYLVFEQKWRGFHLVQFTSKLKNNGNFQWKKIALWYTFIGRFDCIEKSNSSIGRIPSAALTFYDPLFIFRSVPVENGLRSKRTTKTAANYSSLMNVFENINNFYLLNINKMSLDTIPIQYIMSTIKKIISLK